MFVGSTEIESSDDEPLIDLAGKGRSREQSVEQEVKKPKLGPEEENRFAKFVQINKLRNKLINPV